MSNIEEINNEICRLQRINYLLDLAQLAEETLYLRNQKLINELELVRDAALRPKRSNLKLVINN